jgi:hypothetical protein
VKYREIQFDSLPLGEKVRNVNQWLHEIVWIDIDVECLAGTGACAVGLDYLSGVMQQGRVN